MPKKLSKEFFQALGCFDYNAANKLSTKISKLNVILGNLFTTLIKCEQSYTSLEYVKTKSTKKEEVRYQAIPINFPNINPESLVKEIEEVLTKINEIKLNEKLGPLGIGVEKEVFLLKHLFLARKAIAYYNFKDSTINLFKAKINLTSWKDICSQQIYSEKSSSKSEESTSSFFQSFFSSSSDKQTKNIKRGNDSPNHIKWLEKFLTSLTAKMTLYFMDILLEREKSPTNIKSLWRRIDIDYYGLIRNFQKKSGALSILLIYEVSDDIPFYPQGYVCGGLKYEKPIGLSSFPCIYSYPKETPSNHWANIISIMHDKDPSKHTLFNHVNPIYFFDKKFGSSYYYIRIDEFVVLVIIFLEKNSTRDNNTIDFITSLAKKLSDLEILTSLVNGQIN
ncbi:6373_t:CDS:2 [Entrophospora sp. SA101]|nr:16316_t:CDS:2 [Entrophospora sp. SA101]CAJ0752641.1 6373_t:CDS:2 [Entrophospora sp. SA101]CAJ0842789.1 7517_t:CDS:2 [Entrophospora sp. SA101]